MRRVYIAPNRKCLDNFAKICSCPYFRGDVREVVLVPMILWDREDDRQLTDRMMQDGYSEFTTRSYISYEEYAEKIISLESYKEEPVSVREDPIVLAKSWKLYVRATDERASCRQDYKSLDETVAAAFTQALGQALSHLPRLSKISVLPSVENSGLNADSFWYSYEYAINRFRTRTHIRSTVVAASYAAIIAEALHRTDFGND